MSRVLSSDSNSFWRFVNLKKFSPRVVSLTKLICPWNIVKSFADFFESVYTPTITLDFVRQIKGTICSVMCRKLSRFGFHLGLVSYEESEGHES